MMALHRARQLLPALLLLALLILGLRPDAALAQSFPPLSGRVVDAANILSPENVAQLTQKLTALEQTTGRQVVVATVPSLDDQDVSDYGYQLLRVWGLGDKERNDGVVFVVAPQQRRMTIQVGYGLEPVLTDALSGRIIRDIVTPRFKANDYPGGISAGVDEIIRILELPPEQQRKLANEAGRKQHQFTGKDLQTAIFIVIFIVFFVLLPLTRGMSRGGRRYRGGINPIIIWGADAALRSILNSRDDDHWGGGGGGWGGGGGGGFSGGGGSGGGGGASGGW